MELFGCGIATDLDIHDDDRTSSSPNRHGRGQQYSHLREEDMLANKKRHLELMERDYVQLHEDFFDSLLKEEGDRILASIAVAVMSSQQNGAKNPPEVMNPPEAVNPPEVLTSEQNGVNSASCSLASEHTAQSSGGNNSNSNSNSNSNHTRTSTKSGRSVSSNKTVKLGRCGSWGSRRRRNSKSTEPNIEAYDQMYNPNGGTNSTKQSDNTQSVSKESTPASTTETPAGSNGKKASSSTLSIADIMAKTHLESPSHYLHTQCKLQKDKGKGETLGNAISAEGREQTLTKLRDKMKLILEVSGELETSSVNNKDLASMDSPPSGGTTNGSFKTMSAGIKRRRAKIASIEHNDLCTSGGENGSYVIETRSMIEFQLGFLSMQYGLLVRWDAYKSGQVVFVCLRKMCHDSFYTKIPSPPRIISTKTATGAVSSASSQYPKSILKNTARDEVERSPSANPNRPEDTTSVTKKREINAPFVIRNSKGGNHAIYQRSSGSTEVVLVDAPYRVPHPKAFSPSILSLDVHHLTGLDPKSRWTLIMTFDGDTEIAHLKYNQREGVFETTRTSPCKWELSIMPHRSTVASFDVATGLEIRLFEQRPKHRLRVVASGVAGMVGGRYSQSSSSYVPAGSDPFSMTSPSNGYVVQNQRLTYYSGSGNSRNGSYRISRSNSENSLGSNNSGTGSSSKKSKSRLASTMTVPLGGLVCQPSTSHTTLWKLTIPFTHDEDAEVTLTLMHQSEYAHWLHQELRARRKEEAAISYGTKSSDLWRCLVSPMHGDGEDSCDEYTFTSEADDTDVYCMEYLYYCCIDPR